MKKFAILVVFVLLLALSVSLVSAKDDGCATIQKGTITYSAGHYWAGQSLTTGYDAYGYNYQAHQFSGSYVNVYLGGAGFPPYDGNDDAYLAANPLAENHWAWPYRSTRLVMKWNDAWISNKDCNGDGALDRHFDFPSYIGSGAWETNHQWDTYELDGELCEWDYFTKIIAVPADATSSGGYWYAADGTQIGPVLWGQFATIQSVYNDPCGGFEGIEFLSQDHAGWGGWD